MGLLMVLGLSGCTGIPIPQSVDDAARGYGLQLDQSRKYPTDLKVGECLEEPQGDAVMALRVLDCADEHGAEMVHHATVVSGEQDLPSSTSEAWLDVEDECIAAIEDYVGEDFQTSDWDFGMLTPDQVGWGAGERTAQCLLLHVEARTWSGTPSTGEVTLLEMLGPDEVGTQETDAGPADA